MLRDGGGYRLRVDAESSDVPRFRRLVADARGADREAVRVYVDAIGLWSAPCAQRLRREPLGDQDFAALDRECLSAVAEAADAALRCGEVHDVLPLRHSVVPHDPLNEELHARLILVPAESGQQAEAESVYRGVVGRLADELGIDPGPRLRAAHRTAVGGESAMPGGSVPRSCRRTCRRSAAGTPNWPGESVAARPGLHGRPRLGDALTGSGDRGAARSAWSTAADLIENGRTSRVGPSLFSVDDVRDRSARLDEARPGDGTGRG